MNESEIKAQKHSWDALILLAEMLLEETYGGQTDLLLEQFERQYPEIAA